MFQKLTFAFIALFSKPAGATRTGVIFEFSGRTFGSIFAGRRGQTDIVSDLTVSSAVSWWAATGVTIFLINTDTIIFTWIWSTVINIWINLLSNRTDSKVGDDGPWRTRVGLSLGTGQNDENLSNELSQHVTMYIFESYSNMANWITYFYFLSWMHRLKI